MMKQKRFSLAYTQLTNILLCDILGNAMIAYSLHRREWSGTFPFVQKGQASFQVFLQSVPFLCGFCTCGEVAKHYPNTEIKDLIK